MPHKIEGEDSDIIRDMDAETQLEQARTTTRGSEQGPPDPDGAALEPARTTVSSGQSSDNNHSGAEENIAWYNSTPNMLLLDFVHATFEKPMIAMFERDEYRKILLLGKKGSLPWKQFSCNRIILLPNGSHRGVATASTFLSEKLRSKIQTMCDSYIAWHRLTKQKDEEAWVDAL